MYTHVIFDLDGTLLNTIDDLAHAGNWVCQRHHWPQHTVEDYKTFVGNGIPKLVERMVPAADRGPETVSAALAEFSARYSAHKAEQTAPYAGVPQAVVALRAAGISMAVLSNKADGLAGAVVEHYYPGVFPLVQGAVDGVPTKPDPTLLRRLMAAMGAQGKRVLFVGDSDVDIRTAKNGGLPSCGVLWGFRSRRELETEGADFLVETPAELVRLCLGAAE